ncbi:hypothetical protein LTR53_017351, partial [Teratosphaeriaceae sp. CCFEE 6253]
MSAAQAYSGSGRTERESRSITQLLSPTQPEEDVKTLWLEADRRVGTLRPETTGLNAAEAAVTHLANREAPARAGEGMSMS